MVSPNEYWVLGPLQPVSPFLQGSVNGQQFPVPHVVVAFRRGEAPRQERDWMDLLVLRSPLGQYGPDAGVRCVDLHNELASRVGEDEHRSRSEQTLQGQKSLFGRRGPGKGRVNGGQSGKWGGHSDEAPNEPPIKVCKPQETSELGPIRWARPLLHRLDFLRIGPNSSLLQNVPEELHGVSGEDALFSFHKQPVLQQAL